MKRILYSLPILFLVLFACKKDHVTKPNPRLPATDSSLMGAWKLDSYSHFPGGPETWEPATTDLRFAFYSANVFQSFGDSNKFDHYMIATAVSDTTLKIYHQGKTDTTEYFLRITADTLYLNTVVGIVANASRFIRSGMIGD